MKQHDWLDHDDPLALLREESVPADSLARVRAGVAERISTHQTHFVWWRIMLAAAAAGLAGLAILTWRLGPEPKMPTPTLARIPVPQLMVNRSVMTERPIRLKPMAKTRAVRQTRLIGKYQVGEQTVLKLSTGIAGVSLAAVSSVRSSE
jgi:hypothetical protein